MKNLIVLLIILFMASCQKETFEDNQKPDVSLTVIKNTVKVDEALIIGASTSGVDTVMYTWQVNSYFQKSNAARFTFTSSKIGTFVVKCYAHSHHYTDEDSVIINVIK